MVDPIGAKPTNSVDRTVSPIAAARRSQATRPAVERDSPALAETARDFARSAPVDASRVEQLRSAIRDGSFSLDAQAVADRMMATRERWLSDDQA